MKTYGGVHKWRVPQVRRMVFGMENPRKIWMMTGSTHILGHLHMGMGQKSETVWGLGDRPQMPPRGFLVFTYHPICWGTQFWPEMACNQLTSHGLEVQWSVPFKILPLSMPFHLESNYPISPRLLAAKKYTIPKVTINGCNDQSVVKIDLLTLSMLLPLE